MHRFAHRIETLAALVLASVFLLAAMLKSINPEPAQLTVAKLLPGLDSARVFVFVVVILEWIGAIWLLCGLARRTAWIAAGCAVALMSLFAVAGRMTTPEASCGCFGGTFLDLPSLLWIRTSLVLLLAGLGLLSHLVAAGSRRTSFHNSCEEHSS